MGKIILDVNDVCKSYNYGPNILEVLKNFTLQLNKERNHNYFWSVGLWKVHSIKYYGNFR